MNRLCLRAMAETWTTTVTCSGFPPPKRDAERRTLRAADQYRVVTPRRKYVGSGPPLLMRSIAST
jgi:hypothetical protein